MKKIILAIVAISTLASADTIKVKDFLENALKANPSMGNVKVIEKYSKDLKNLKGWKAVNIEITGKLKNGRKINETSTFFTNGVYLVNNLTNMLTGEQITLRPVMTKKDYLKRNLISGNSKSKHKVAIFSDPECPFCRRRVPPLIRILKRYPDEFAVYYYDLPLAIHPASDTIVRLSMQQRYKKSKNKKLEAVLAMYDLQIDPMEKNKKQIIKNYNIALNEKMTEKDIHDKKIENFIQKDQEIANKLNINGTPTIYFDGDYDMNGEKYKKFLIAK